MMGLEPEAAGAVELSSELDRDTLLERAQKIRNLLARPNMTQVWREYTRLLVQYTEACDVFAEVDRKGKLLVPEEARNQDRQLQASREALGTAFNTCKQFLDENQERIQAVKGLLAELRSIEDLLQNPVA